MASPAKPQPSPTKARRRKIGKDEIEELQEYGAAVGIDLGTTNSAVGVWLPSGRVEILSNRYGKNTTPSCVAFLLTETLVGDDAVDQAEINQSNTVFEAKRFLGKKFNDDSVQDDMRYLRCAVVSVDERPQFSIEHLDKKTTKSPEQVAAEVLLSLKKDAELYLRQKVTRAVITVPAFFNNAQREATKAAGALAGLEVLRILNEPTAAAISYQLDKNLEGSRNILVFDLGGGTFDVSILEVVDDIFEVRATYGNTRLGGVDFDKRLMDFVAQELKQKHRVEILENPVATRRLRAACERAKIALSSQKETTIEVDSIAQGIDVNVSLTRGHFETICKELFIEIIDTVERSVRAAGVNKQEISDIVVVGGSSAIPKIHSDLQTLFDGPEQRIQTHLDPNEAVARGASLQAAALSAIQGKPQRVLLLDATPLPLGVETAGRVLTPFIAANTMIPFQSSMVFTTAADNQTKMLIRVIEGEHALSRHRDNYYLSKFVLEDIPAAPRGVPQIEITFALDSDGLLSVSAKDLLSGQQATTDINMERDRLTRDDVRRMRLRAEEAAGKEQLEVAKIEAKNALECYAYRVQSAIADDDVCRNLGAGGEAAVRSKAEETIGWLRQSDKVAGTDELQQKQQELEAVALPAMLNLYRGDA